MSDAERPGGGTSAGIIAYLGLGSNLGDRAALIWEATRLLQDSASVSVLAVSPLYETEPVGPVAQGPFLNAALVCRTALPSELLLSLTQQIERKLGRRRGLRWGPRTIDVDLLLYGEVQRDTPGLTLPHPELWNRAFVLVPLLEVARGVPLTAQIKARLSEIGGAAGVHPYLGSSSAVPSP